MKTIFILLFGFVFIVMSCHPISKTTGEVSSSSGEIEEISSRQINNLTMKWEKWYNEQNIDSLITLYTADAIIITSDNSAVTGLNNIKAFYSKQFAQIDGRIELTVGSIDICTDVAIERGIWNIEYGSNKYSGKYVTQWKMINGSWLTQLDVSLVEE